MVSVNDSYAGNHLKCADLKGKDVTLTIASVAMEKVGDDHKLVAYFRGTEKDLVLNKTNANCIAQMYGDETDRWLGMPVTVIPTQTEFGGKTIPAAAACRAWPNTPRREILFETVIRTSLFC